MEFIDNAYKSPVNDAKQTLKEEESKVIPVLKLAYSLVKNS
jgi:hypothetical protein